MKAIEWVTSLTCNTNTKCICGCAIQLLVLITKPHSLDSEQFQNRSKQQSTCSTHINFQFFVLIWRRFFLGGGGGWEDLCEIKFLIAAILHNMFRCFPHVVIKKSVSSLLAQYTDKRELLNGIVPKYCIDVRSCFFCIHTAGCVNENYNKRYWVFTIHTGQADSFRGALCVH